MASQSPQRFLHLTFLLRGAMQQGSGIMFNRLESKHQFMIGSMMYPMIQTRPDICFAITVLSRYNQNPNFKHIVAAKRVLRYLKGTITHDITYGASDGLVGFTDAD